MLNFFQSRRPLVLAAALLAVPALAQDKRQVVTNADCTVEVLKGDGSPAGSLVISNQGGTYEARMDAAGDRAAQEGQKYYNFTFTRRSAMVFQGYDFWLKFTAQSGASYQCHIISKITGDKIAVSDESWAIKKGLATVQTDPGQTLLTLSFK